MVERKVPIDQGVWSQKILKMPGAKSSDLDFDVSIIVPTRNEADNVKPLLERIKVALTGYHFEVIFVDDSTDNTPNVITDVRALFPFDISVIARPPERRNGLGKAVVEGLNAARSKRAVVMDGDLQHPPEMIPRLLEVSKKKNADIVVASRLSEGGSTEGLSWYRVIVSYTVTILSHIFFPKNLRGISDPMTGFFLVCAEKINLQDLQPNGFKILLEILCTSGSLNVTEIPFQFQKRHAGESKANGREMIRLFQQIYRLRFEKIDRLLRFGFVGLTGIVVNTLMMFVFADLLNVHYLIAALFATQFSTTWNFYLINSWVFRDRNNSEDRVRRFLAFYGMNNSLLLARGPLLALFVSFWGIHHLIANVITLLMIVALRYLVSEKFIWKQERNTELNKSVQQPYYYDVHGIVTLRSDERLPELHYFKVNSAIESPDIDVKIVSNPKKYVESSSVVYEEILGRFGFSIVINRSEEVTRVFASKLIGKSPHVLYTNVVEPLMRWGLVRKGYALMHGACLSFDGKGLFITAQTDTGKTTTILFTIQNNLTTAEFLSDDMTIFRQDGVVFNYPKPLTISQHTVQAIGGSPLTRRERMFLRIQSRLHSKGGRRIGMLLNAGIIPTASLNALVQAIIPPPKYMVDKLVPGAKFADEAQLAHIVLIERGNDLELEINDLQKVGILVANAEDAYGFPPYPQLANQLSVWNGESLHFREREVVAGTTRSLPGTFIRRSDYGWYKRLPQLIENLHQEEMVTEPSSIRTLREEIVEQSDVSNDRHTLNVTTKGS